MASCKRYLKTLIVLLFICGLSTGFLVQLVKSNLKSSHIHGRSSSGDSEVKPTSSRAEEVKKFERVFNIVATGLTVGSLSSISSVSALESPPRISLSPLPYDYKALSPFLSEKTLITHHDKHHAKYVSTTLSMIKGTDLEDADLVSVMRNARGIAPVLFNNAAQSWNHDFYWKCMQKGGGGPPTGNTASIISKNFGSYEAFKSQFATAGNTAFGSGWAWLVQKQDGSLEVLKTIGAENPLMDGKKPLLTMDVWEHAYYLDYQNNRGLYVDAFLDHLVNWSFVESQIVQKA